MSKRSDDFSKECLGMMTAPYDKVKVPEDEKVAITDDLVHLSRERKISLRSYIVDVNKNQSNFFVMGSETDSYKTRVCRKVAENMEGVDFLEVEVDEGFLKRDNTEDYDKVLLDPISRKQENDQQLLVVFNGLSGLFRSPFDADSESFLGKDKKIFDLSMKLAQAFSDYKYYRSDIVICAPVDDISLVPSVFTDPNVFGLTRYVIDKPGKKQRKKIIVNKLAELTMGSIYHGDPIIDPFAEPIDDPSKGSEDSSVQMIDYIDDIVRLSKNLGAEELEKMLGLAANDSAVNDVLGENQKIDQRQIFVEISKYL